MAEVYANAGFLAAQIAGDSIEMDQVAEKLANRARANALANGDKDFAESITVEKVGAKVRRSVPTRLVIATDPLAAPKELGHVVRNEADGPILGYAKPLRYMFRALQAMPEVTGD